jgi:DNA helicase-2/ATP-dependent DNA helicase PcrA
MHSDLTKRFRTELNPAQYEAVFHDQGPLLVIAGAGSGKTRTLTYRAARLVEDGIPPGAILLLTFTRKAAGEMLQRAARLLDDRCHQIAGGTFHAFANLVLRRYAAQIGFASGFAIMDRADSENLIGLLLKEMMPGKRLGAFPRNRTLADIFSRAANKSQALEDIIDAEYPHFWPYLDTLLALRTRYAEAKSAQALLDYDDLLTGLCDLLDRQPAVRKALVERYTHLMVDEYQDTNHVQARIVYLLAGDHRNIMVVGDDSQSIYSFRGADFRNIMDFPTLFPGTRLITLEENYRSTKPILSLTNELIDQASEKYPKHLFSQRAEGQHPLLVQTESENRQSRFVVDQIRQLNRQGVALQDMAVLFRAGFHAFDLEIELTRAGIPYVKYGGFKFMESAHIKDVLAHMRLLINPLDRISWLRILQLVENVGPKTAQAIYAAIPPTTRSLRSFLERHEDRWHKPGLLRLRELLAAIDDPQAAPVSVGEQIINYYLPILRVRHDDHPKRLRDLQQLLEVLEHYAALEPFLADMTLEPPSTAVSGTFETVNSQEDRLVLSTVHSAKGLEWHTVFILWAMDGRFPALQATDNPLQLDEELRLMYVAATRARERLYFLCPEQVYDRSSGMLLSRPSRFLETLPEQLLPRRTAEIW